MSLSHERTVSGPKVTVTSSRRRLNLLRAEGVATKMSPTYLQQYYMATQSAPPGYKLQPNQSDLIKAKKVQRETCIAFSESLSVYKVG